jgi:hypothetical protein
MARKIFGIEVSGVDMLALRLSIADKKLHSELEKGMFRAGTKIQKRAQEILTINEHIVTGNLRRSINTQTIVEESKLEVQIGTNMEYAPFVEALPDGGYLFPAYIQLKDEVIGDLQKIVTQVINEAKGV